MCITASVKVSQRFKKIKLLQKLLKKYKTCSRKVILMSTLNIISCHFRTTQRIILFDIRQVDEFPEF